MKTYEVWLGTQLLYVRNSVDMAVVLAERHAETTHNQIERYEIRIKRA